MKAQMRSTVIALPMLNSGTRWEWVVHTTLLAALHHQERVPLVIVQEAGWCGDEKTSLFHQGLNFELSIP
jgi:hypothetical protein